MKILYAVRLFSGLETSFLEREWKPTGAPTIYKIIEALDKSDHEIVLLFTCKETFLPWKTRRDSTFYLKGLIHPITVLSGYSFLPKFMGSLRSKINELCHIFKIVFIAIKSQPDIVYINNTNIIAGALISRLTKIKVVIRIMGVYPAMREVYSDNSILFNVFRWAYRSPFSQVICTQDASGAEKWLPKAFKNDIPVKLLFNGVDWKCEPPVIDSRLARLPQDKTLVVFVGKLEEAKGCMEFLHAFIQANRQVDGLLHALIVGEGPCKKEMKRIVTVEKTQNHITFIHHLHHQQIQNVHRISDIYVSTNTLANFCNANLEAMCFGNCIILPKSDPETGVDLIIDKLIPDGVVSRVAHGDVLSLTKEIVRLHHDRSARKRMRSSVSEVSRAIIPSWKQRIDTELKLLEEVGAREYK